VGSYTDARPLVCAVGDLVEDVVVRAHASSVRDADVPASIARHRGGSAANTAATVARLGGRARFVGAVGADDTGDRLLASLRSLGVEHAGPRHGRTGTVVVLVEPDGSRTMFSDRGASAGFMAADERWLDDARAVHVPFYAIAAAPDGAARQLLDAARARGMIVSMDPSTTVLAGTGFARVVREVEPDVVFCNAAEARELGIDEHGLPGAHTVVVKRGGASVLVRGRLRAELVVPPIATVDSTGAGDALAGGFLLAYARGDGIEAAVRIGIAAAARVVRGTGADSWLEQ
jgi:sugar/nucleoside kinase (ribokinase family)